MTEFLTNAINEPFEVNYQIFVDMGEDGTKTIFSSHSYQNAKDRLVEVGQGNLDNVDLDEDELENVQAISLQQTILAPKNRIQTISYGEDVEVVVELNSEEVKKPVIQYVINAENKNGNITCIQTFDDNFSLAVSEFAEAIKAMQDRQDIDEITLEKRYDYTDTVRTQVILSCTFELG